EVVGIDVMTPGATLLTDCEKGYGKRTDVDEYRVQSRGGIGLKDVLTNDRNGPVVGVACVTDRHEVLLITEQGQVIRTNAADLRPIGRNTLGVKLMDLAPEDRVVSLATLVEPDGDGEGSGGSDDGADATAGSETAAPDAEASDTATADE